MTKVENDVDKSCSHNLLFLKENRFQEDLVDFWPLKLTLKTENALFLSARHYLYLQDIILFFDYDNFYTQMLLFLDTRVRNSTTQWTIIGNQ